MSSTQHTYLPPQYSVEETVANNRVRQLLRPEFAGDLPVEEIKCGKTRALVVTRPDGSRVAVVARKVPPESFDGDILHATGVPASQLQTALDRTDRKRWLKVSAISGPDAPASDATRPQRVLESWEGAFSFSVGDPSTGTFGLRKPQLGALYATLAHWTVAPEQPATIVMPTGTGKTETMLAVAVHQRLPCLLVVVPNNALRDQISRKFLTLGMLPSLGIVDPAAPLPLVGTVEHQFETPADAEAFFRSCNVVVATMQVVNGCAEEVRRKIEEVTSHLIVDEAHHVSAPSWDTFRQRFFGKPILQFTATPYRNDGKQVTGRMIYCYPLRKAQEEGYFNRINFRPVFDLLLPDRTIAEAAALQVRSDRAAGKNHIAMARVGTIERATDVAAIYREVAPDLNPILIHSQLSDAERRDAVAKLRSFEVGVIICVDMLGEGFDLPELKVAALHDVHKSLAVTLQFIGRFTRVKDGSVGEATAIANIASVDVQERLRALYAQDADWDEVIRDLSHEATGQEERRSEFQQTFQSLPTEVSIQTVEPRMSTVVYRTECKQWNPEAVRTVFSDEELYTGKLGVSEERKVLWFVTQATEPVRWGDAQGLANVSYHLFVLHWDEPQQLLYVNSSDNGSVHEDLAKAVAGDWAKIVSGETVYRSMHGIKRMVPTNLGLLDTLSHARRFTMHVGADVVDGLQPSQKNTKVKTNLFAYGFEDGARATIGCSLKGRIWSYLAAHDLSEWVDWCHHVGAKLLDDTIDTDAIVKGFIKPEPVTSRPPLVPLAIEWPLEFLATQEDRISVEIGGDAAPFFDVGLEIIDFTASGPIRFRVSTEHRSADYDMTFGPDGMAIAPVGAAAAITIGKRTKSLSDWFRTSPPKIHFEQDTTMEQGFLFRRDRAIDPYDPDAIDTWPWAGVNIRKESQGTAKAADSIQRRVIETVLADGTWDLVFDDDDSREAADVVAIKMTGERLIVHLYHCKFSKKSTPGHRIDDMYAVCGQAQKSILWRDRNGVERLVRHLIARERSRISKGMPSRIEKGDLQTMNEIVRRGQVLIPEYRVWVVQPGLSKQEVTPDILQLLAATQLYLSETFSLGFGIVASA